jgi:ATP/maltotriose-dependent transcriptional regulator MalT
VLLSPLVLTKLRVPALRPRIVPRTRPLGRLTPDPDAGFVLVSVPAACGKTTTHALWAGPPLNRGAAVASYALDANDDSPSLFAADPVAALPQALARVSTLLPTEQFSHSSPEPDRRKALPSIKRNLGERLFSLLAS